MVAPVDYFKKGKNKFNINRLIDLKGWEKEECLFFGDALFPGGNDETVNGVIQPFLSLTLTIW